MCEKDVEKMPCKKMFFEKSTHEAGFILFSTTVMVL